MKAFSDPQGSQKLASSARFLRKPQEGVRHQNTGLSQKEGTLGWMALETDGGKRPRVKAMHQAQRAACPAWSRSEAQGDISQRG